ncbi:NADH dehydrogenase [ubiquinone] 1 alpha subcomplex subunit 6 [Strongyloides ratti]|uniref:NADH dehydrogenase [ubiquinone] 1 alpha subcomplex subunit 6 n=1 Tax=Strongyloides ratti TaxID=34506 RepID=A0A090LJF5_STRRB|nr:NADH dehydrogenase [ubiquinone] 1 alpha subcomplex subunit 6 [Strongyloides ratti]CEF69833.1 NADH dehydrogenase [ubiquinone] 1 alpha subcomplex subunit 6 [Strongyloides ratti]
MSNTAGRLAKIGGELSTKLVKPVVSSTKEEARKSVLKVYKDLQRIAPKFWYEYELQEMPLSVFREILKKQFLKNKNIQDVRIIDRKVAECRNDLLSIKYYFYNPDHVRNMLFRENLDAKPADFLSKFLSGKN